MSLHWAAGLLSMLMILPAATTTLRADEPSDASSLRGKVLCGYQGWFRCPGDAADQGWVH